MSTKLRESVSWEKAMIAFLFLLGITLRLRQYLTGRSLWADEAMLALNIVNRSIGGLFKPLDYDQGAPIGFLLVEKMFNLLFGRNEYALRLFPLLTGILSIWLFYLLSKRITKGAGLITALALFVLNPRLIYYSSEAKQYMVDVAVCLALLLLASPLFENKSQKKDFVRLAAAGFLALWFSHPSVFVLAGIGLTLVIMYLKRRDTTHLGYVIGMGILWMITVGVLYLLVLNELQQNAYMQEYWQGAFFPFPPWSDPGWFDRSLTENIGVQFGIPYGVDLVFGFMLAGWIVLWQTRRTYALAFGLTLFLTLAASAVRLYPVFERMILFLIPIGLILIGKTVEALDRKLQSLRWAGKLITLAIAGFMIYGPLITSISNFIEPKYFEHIHPAMQFLDDTWKDGDIVFVTHGAVPAFEYYAPAYGLTGIPYLSSQRQDYQQPERILKQLDSLLGRRRAWILMSHVYEKGDFNERGFIL
ncbi:MAG TPA: glycosyltransferase family 39 protein, partial [Anaerolineales bacterium]|nr:glycosyltransferase family 39 protein [Anaerolineales bacterium]